MALFTFIKDSGINLPEMGRTGASSTERAGDYEDRHDSRSNPAASERLEKLVHDQQLNLKNLSIVLEGHAVHLSGSSKDQETKEKVILLLGNIKGVEEVNEKVTVEEPAPESRFHTVARADTPETIAENIFGDPRRAQEIIEANKPMVQTAADMYPGQVLRIPYQNGSS